MYMHMCIANIHMQQPGILLRKSLLDIGISPE
jgi:hypothetical protein